jgi:mannan endo-1,4-beta-mannosidase
MRLPRFLKSKTMKNILMLLILFFGALLWLQAETIVIDNFDDNIVHPNWQVEGTTFSLSAQDMALRVDYNRTASSWEWDQFHVNVETPYDLFQYQIVLSLKSSVSFQLAVKPVYTDGTSDWLTKEVVTNEAYQTFTLNVSSSNLKVIQTIFFYFDGGSTQIKSGVVYIDYVSIQTTSTAVLTQTISNAELLSQNASEGSLEGNYSPGSLVPLNEAKQQAQNVVNNQQSTQQQIDQALEVLFEAIRVFEAGRIRSDKLNDLSLACSNATFETMNMYYNLRQIARYNTLFGMQDATGYGVGWTGNNFRSDVEDVCGSLPAVCSWSIKDVASGSGFDDLRQRIQYIYNSGGINTFEWHMDNPYGGDFYWDNNPYPDSNVVRSILPNGVNHVAWRNQLDNIALFMNTLKGAKGESIPVIFRPWHEHTGNWFWWGEAHCSIDEYKLLWQFTVNYLVNVKKVRNIIFAYSPDRFFTKTKYLQRYPGNNYIDIFGFDDYGDVQSTTGIETLLQQLRHLVEMAETRNKIPALTETGLERITNINWFTQFMLNPIKNDPIAKRIAYQAVWRNASVSHHYAPYPGHPSVPDFLIYYNDPFTVFIDDLPEIYGKALTITEPLSLDDLSSSPNNIPEVFPNPAADVIYLKAVDKETNFIIFNASGLLVYSGITTDEPVTVIDLQNFDPGIYFIKLISAEKTVMNKKFIIIR